MGWRRRRGPARLLTGMLLAALALIGNGPLPQGAALTAIGTPPRSATLVASAAPPAAAALGSFVEVLDGDRLGVAGQPWRVKAVQFWMTDYVTGPPAGWYNTWVMPQDAQYLEQARWQIASLARANLGANTLRIFFQFGQVTDANGNFLKEPGNPALTTLDHLDVVLALAAGQGMNATIVLFGPESCGERTGCWSPGQERFVTAMAQHFRNRPQLVYWGTVNEINDHQWGETLAANRANRDLRLNWHWQIASALRTHDPNHLISASVQSDDKDGTATRALDYFQPVSWNPAGTLANVVDFLTPHSFLGVKQPNQDMVRALREGAPGKPIVFEEIGWPTGRPVQDGQYTEEVQATAIEALLAAAAGDGAVPAIAGVGVWMLVDFNGWPDFASPEQPYYGLFWSDYTATNFPGAALPPSPWSRKAAADLVQRHFQEVWPD